MSVKSITTVLAASAIIGGAATYSIVDWTDGDAEIVRKSYNIVTDSQGNEISQHSDPAKAFQAALNQSLQTGGTFYVTPPAYEVKFNRPDPIDFGMIELREAGGVIVIDGIDIVTADPPPDATLEGTHLTTKLIAASGRAKPRVILIYDTAVPVALRMLDRAEDPSNPGRNVYETTVTPSVRVWPNPSPIENIN